MEPSLEFGIWLFFWLLFGHALGDFSLQSDTIAVGKNRQLNPAHVGVPWYYWMFAHSLVHGGVVGIITHSAVLGMFETVAHFGIDVLKCEKYTNIHVDQLLHVLCKIVWILIFMDII